MQSEVKKTLDWANELSEAWVGTIIGDILENDLSSVQVLRETCEYAQRELEGEI